METSKQSPTPVAFHFGDPGFWHNNKPFGYDQMTKDIKEYWTNFIESTPKEDELKAIGSTGTGSGRINFN